jgi:hypothetical protein
MRRFDMAILLTKVRSVANMLLPILRFWKIVSSSGVISRITLDSPTQRQSISQMSQTYIDFDSRQAIIVGGGDN